MVDWAAWGTYLQPVAMGSDQFSWNHWTCWEPGDVSVRRMRCKRDVVIVGGGVGLGDMLVRMLRFLK